MTKVIRSVLPHHRAQISAQRAFEALLAGPAELALEPKESEMTLCERIQSHQRRLAEKVLCLILQTSPGMISNHPRLTKTRICLWLDLDVLPRFDGASSL